MIVIKRRGCPPLVFRGDYDAETPDSALGRIVPRTGALSWQDPCQVNGQDLPLSSDLQLNPGDKLVVHVG